MVGSDICLVARDHGPAVQLDIFRKGTHGERLLSADLVPCFQVGPHYYVAKTYTTWRRSVSSPDLLWRQSFSLKEKEILEYMDRDHGCRHELLRIVKTIVKRHPESFKKLAKDSYCLKTAFMYYIGKGGQNWLGDNALGEHFLGFLGELQSYLERGNLPHYWLPGVDLLDDIGRRVLVQMANRLKKILNNELVRNKILA
ncbi:hypothetical protein OS493_039019 [Desmophyllum pertusum]|uniref:Mab-21-like HhH/H2TH-like domain-containing protein n=1 Tax=Desmophyllum pertusum TaxID=174260 RepID=A0A9X0D7B3_9CNID|nr:hypothetical protein OS493_039019 [Desmophyllum pertusum]